jgi:hypothetical protein
MWSFFPLTQRWPLDTSLTESLSQWFITLYLWLYCTGTPDIKRCSTDTILTDSFHFCRYLYTITIHGVWECSCNKIKHQNKGLFFVRYNESSSYACSKIHFLTLLIFLVFCVVLLCVFTFWVQCCDVHYDLRIKMMFGFVFTSSL